MDGWINYWMDMEIRGKVVSAFLKIQDDKITWMDVPFKQTCGSMTAKVSCLLNKLSHRKSLRRIMIAWKRVP